MPYSKAVIANLALAHIGQGKEVNNIDTENSQAASACRQFFDISVESALRDARWPFATTRRTLALVAADPNDEWNYSYRYPSDCLFVRRILSGLRNDTEASRVVYKIEKESGSDALLIFTDEENAEAEYTIRLDNTSLFPPDFAMALSYRLAVYIAPRLTAGDPFKLRDAAAQLYRAEIAKANASAFNESQPEQPPDAELIRERE